MTISELSVRSAFDSRGEPTIAVCVRDVELRQHTALVPTGKSRGSGEVSIFGVVDAKRSIAALKRVLIGTTFRSVQEFDNVLLGVDGTADKSILGGNVTLAVSMAMARALAAEERRELWEVLRQEFFPVVHDVRPKIYANFINGGAHASTGLAIQEYLVVAAPATSYVDLTAELVLLYRSLALGLKKSGSESALPIGDESGYAIPFSDSLQPLNALTQLLAEAGSNRFSLGIDAAASSFFKDNRYAIDEHHFTTAQLVEFYAQLHKAAPLLMSIEDPCAENDVDGFHLLRQRLPEIQVVGDDLTVSNVGRIETEIAAGRINAVIIKPNQVGTVSEACRAIAVAHRHNIGVIVSHRSGETEDTFIIALAKAGSADGVKIGAPVHERVVKYNELIRLYDGTA